MTVASEELKPLCAAVSKLPGQDSNLEKQDQNLL